MSGVTDALLVVSFGGPEGPDDVRPFLENVLRGRNVPMERLQEVAAHYETPINAHIPPARRAAAIGFDEHQSDDLRATAHARTAEFFGDHQYDGPLRRAQTHAPLAAGQIGRTRPPVIALRSGQILRGLCCGQFAEFLAADVEQRVPERVRREGLAAQRAAVKIGAQTVEAMSVRG